MTMTMTIMRLEEKEDGRVYYGFLRWETVFSR